MLTICSQYTPPASSGHHCCPHAPLPKNHPQLLLLLLGGHQCVAAFVAPRLHWSHSRFWATHPVGFCLSTKRTCCLISMLPSDRLCLGEHRRTRHDAMLVILICWNGLCTSVVARYNDSFVTSQQPWTFKGIIGTCILHCCFPYMRCTCTQSYMQLCVQGVSTPPQHKTSGQACLGRHCQPVQHSRSNSVPTHPLKAAFVDLDLTSFRPAT